jgi:hypothetical protein
MVPLDRRYAVRRVVLRGQVIFFLVLALSWTLLISDRAALVFVAFATIATLATIWQGVDLVRNAGVRETADGIVNRHDFGYRRWRWEEIETFTHRGSAVYVVTRAEGAWQLGGVYEGWRNQWAGGETREITALLNDRLDAWRTEHPGDARLPPVPPDADG